MDKIITILKFDVLLTRRTIIFLLTWFFVFGSYFAFMSKELFVVPISVMIWATFIAGLPFTYSEKSDVKILLHTFPVNRKSIIRGRYGYSLASGFVCLSMTEIMICILAGFFNIAFNMAMVGFTLCLGFLVFCFIISIQLPMYFKFPFKTEILLSPLFIYLVFTMLYQTLYTNITRYDYTSIIGRFPALTVITTFALCIVMIFISYRTSCKLYINKDL